MLSARTPRQAAPANPVVSTLGGDFDHKSTFELFTSPRFTHLFSPEQRAVFARHVLWTRLVTERRTEGPDGVSIDLAPFIRDHRHALVLKPNRSYGGQGVTIGPDLSNAEWASRLDEALANPGAWVVQAFRPLPRQPFPVFANRLEGVGRAEKYRLLLTESRAEPVPTSDFAGHLFPVLATLPFDPDGAATFSLGKPDPRPNRNIYRQAICRAVTVLDEQSRYAVEAPARRVG